jgi:light-regulated signal transduction histidine kinase (bacteriophytochrome)
MNKISQINSKQITDSISLLSHKLKQPLNAVSMDIQNLEEDYLEGLIDQEFIQSFIEKNYNTIKQMSKIIDEFRYNDSNLN